MPWALIPALAIVFSGAGVLPQKVTSKTVASKASGPVAQVAPDSGPSPNYDAQAEQELLVLANQDRVRVGAPPLEMDPGLTQAARAHAAAMARQQQLSHQLNGEPSLAHRLADTSDLRLDRAGENVALDSNAQQAEQHLLLSPTHRANLLNPAYNVAGFAVVRSGAYLYIVQDFAHRLPTYSLEQTENIVGRAVIEMRSQASLPALHRLEGLALHNAACSMAQEDRLNTRAVHELAQRYSVLAYTNARPEVLPQGTSKLITDRRTRDFSVGVCYGRTATYANGVYWVVLLFH